ncbi:MAG: hypothetical protein V1489_01365 [Candidatus Liptonbacteria bacterium]
MTSPLSNALNAPTLARIATRFAEEQIRKAEDLFAEIVFPLPSLDIELDALYPAIAEINERGNWEASLSMDVDELVKAEGDQRLEMRAMGIRMERRAPFPNRRERVHYARALADIDAVAPRLRGNRFTNH